MSSTSDASLIGQQAAIVQRKRMAAAAAAKASTNQTKRRVFAVGEPDAEPAVDEEHAAAVAEMGDQWPFIVVAFNCLPWAITHLCMN